MKLKVGDKFKIKEDFFKEFGCEALKRKIGAGFVPTVQRIPSKTGIYQYGFSLEGSNYGFDDRHVMPLKPMHMENK